MPILARFFFPRNSGQSVLDSFLDRCYNPTVLDAVTKRLDELSRLKGVPGLARAMWLQLTPIFLVLLMFYPDVASHQGSDVSAFE